MIELRKTLKGWLRDGYTANETPLDGYGAEIVREVLAILPTLDARGLQDRYHELLYAVSMKYPGETRHETALRYIRQAEEHRGEACANTGSPAPEAAPEEP